MDNTSPWAGLRPAVRSRLTAAVEHLRTHGKIRRDEIAQIGEVSLNQATADLRMIQARIPGLIIYDPAQRTYRITTPQEQAALQASAVASPPKPTAPARSGTYYFEVRLSLDMTIARMAALLGVSPAMISRIEAGKLEPKGPVARLYDLLAVPGVVDRLRQFS